MDQHSIVSATDLTDLRTLVANATAIGMPGYVQDLANKVLNGNPADTDYQGKALAALAANSPGWVMQDLVNKWFLGLDLPAVGTGVEYALASGSLFGSGPSYTDVVQGSLSDCYLLAGLAEVAYHSPGTIESMFINNGDGTYAVRFYNGTHADYVTVNLELPELSNGTYAYANFQESLTNTTNKLWVALAEKAYAELAESGWSRGTGAPALTAASRWAGKATRWRSSPRSGGHLADHLSRLCDGNGPAERRRCRRHDRFGQQPNHGRGDRSGPCLCFHRTQRKHAIVQLV